MKWNIITDSSCDAFPVNRENDEILFSDVPFVIQVGQRDFVDDEKLDISEMLRVMELEKTASHTACPSVDAWLQEYEKADCCIAVTISSALSGSMNSAEAARKLALEKYPDKKIAVLDSRSTGPELVMCVEELERLIRQGKDFDSVVREARLFLQKTRVLFALSSFDNLVRNGRMNRLTGFLAKALGMWGVGTASDEGTIEVTGKTRGAAKMIRMILSEMKERSFSGLRVAISHCENAEIAGQLKACILEIWANAEISILPTRGLCSYYAERGGIIISFST